MCNYNLYWKSTESKKKMKSVVVVLGGGWFAGVFGIGVRMMPTSSAAETRTIKYYYITVYSTTLPNVLNHDVRYILIVEKYLLRFETIGTT